MLKRRVKKYLLGVLCLLVAVSIFENSSYFARPVSAFASKFSLVAVSFVLPKGIFFSSETLETEQNYTAPKEEFYEQTPTTQSKINPTLKPTNKITEKTIAVSGEEKGGKVISQTIDKSGATDSYGDVFIRNKTSKTISISKALNTGANFKIKLNSDKPQVLIVHTHASESFFPEIVDYYPKSWGERDTDKNKNMIAVGKVIANALNKAGINTLQSEFLHDEESYTGAYDRSRETIKSYLEKYPSIKVVIDVHRDAINEEDGDKIRPIVNIKNKIAGQIMIVSGCQSGEITGYPNWQKNLRFSVGLQQKLEQKYPLLTRPLFLAEKKYNQDLCENSFLLEVGSQANLLSEAKYSAKLFSEVFIEYLKEHK